MISKQIWSNLDILRSDDVTKRVENWKFYSFDVFFRLSISKNIGTASLRTNSSIYCMQLAFWWFVSSEGAKKGYIRGAVPKKGRGDQENQNFSKFLFEHF